jgi:aquaporin Z
MDSDSVRKYIAEAFGTMVLTLVGCGTAVFTGNIVAIALAFGLSVVAMAYCIGPISGCHINPAITIGMAIDGRMEKQDIIGYIVAQFIGGIIGALLLWIIVGQTDFTVAQVGLGTNGFDERSAFGLSMLGAIIVEILLTAFFVLAALGVTTTKATAAQGGIVIGLALVLVHLIGINLTGTSVNPARSLGPAIFYAFENTVALEQVWVFILAPVIGAVIAGFLWKYLKPAVSE